MRSSLFDADLQRSMMSAGEASPALMDLPEDSELQERFLDNLSERAASMIREEMEFLGDPDPKEQGTVRKEILDVALKLEADGTLVFKEAAGDAGRG